MKLNEKIAYYRRKRGYSQQALADMMGVSRQSVSKWETSESLPEVTKLPQLAALFGVTTDFLLSEDAPAEDNDPPKPEKSAEVEETVPEHHAESGASAADFVRAVPDAVDALADRLPHFLGKLVRLYGWVAGIRIAIAGVLLIVFALLGGVVTSSVSQTADSWDTQGFGTSAVQYFNEDGTPMKTFRRKSAMPSRAAMCRHPAGRSLRRACLRRLCRFSSSSASSGWHCSSAGWHWHSI